MYLLDKELTTEFQDNWWGAGVPRSQQFGPLMYTEKWDGSTLQAGGGGCPVQNEEQKDCNVGPTMPVCLSVYLSTYFKIMLLEYIIKLYQDHADGSEFVWFNFTTSQKAIYI